MMENKNELAHELSTFKSNLRNPEPSSLFMKKYKKEYNMVWMQYFKGIPYSFWIYDFAFVIKYYEDMEIDECITEIFKKYK